MQSESLRCRMMRTPLRVSALQKFRPILSDAQYTVLAGVGCQPAWPISKSARQPRSTQIPRRSDPHETPKVHAESLRLRTNRTPPLVSTGQ
jgi:hypothetical protein